MNDDRIEVLTQLGLPVEIAVKILDYNRQGFERLQDEMEIRYECHTAFIERAKEYELKQWVDRYGYLGEKMQVSGNDRPFAYLKMRHPFAYLFPASHSKAVHPPQSRFGHLPPMAE